MWATWGRQSRSRQPRPQVVPGNESSGPAWGKAPAEKNPVYAAGGETSKGCPSDSRQSWRAPLLEWRCCEPTHAALRRRAGASSAAAGSAWPIGSSVARAMPAIGPSCTRILRRRDLRLDQFRQPPLRIVLVIRPGNLAIGGVDQPQKRPQILLADLRIAAFGVDQGPALGRMVEGVDQQAPARRGESRRSATCPRTRRGRRPTCRSAEATEATVANGRRAAGLAGAR